MTSSRTQAALIKDLTTRPNSTMLQYRFHCIINTTEEIRKSKKN